MAETDNPSQVNWQRKARNTVGWIVGIGLGVAVGVYTGIHVLIPLAFTAAAWSVGKMLLRPEREHFLPAVAVQTGHLLWMSFGLRPPWDRGLYLNAGDVLVLGVGTTWLLLRPNLGAILFLTVYQFLGLALNILVISTLAVGSPLHKLEIIHMIWRLIAVFLMLQAYLTLRKKDAIATTRAGS